MLQAFGLHEQPPAGDFIEKGRGEKRRAPRMTAQASPGGNDHFNGSHGNLFLLNAAHA